MATDMEERKKKSIGSGNMSTPATTSANAAGSGYGYAPLYEALAQSGGYNDAAAMLADSTLQNASLQSDSSGASISEGYDNSWLTGTPSVDYTDEQLADMTLEEQLAAVKSYDPYTILGVDVNKTALGALASLLVNILAPTPLGVGGLIASRIAKGAIQDSRDSNQLNIESYVKGNYPSAGEEMETGVAPESVKAVEEVARTEIVEGATPKVAEEDPLVNWIEANIPTPVESSSGGGYSQEAQAGLDAVVAEAMASPSYDSGSSSSSSNDSGGYAEGSYSDAGTDTSYSGW